MAMMKVRFVHPRRLGGKHYGKGVHPVPKEMEKDWFFQAQVKDGACAVMPDEEVAAAKPQPEEKKAPAKPHPQGK